MAVPKKRTSRRRQGTRRSHLALKLSPAAACSNCGKAVKPHQVCQNCGYYNGKKVIGV